MEKWRKNDGKIMEKWRKNNGKKKEKRRKNGREKEGKGGKLMKNRGIKVLIFFPKKPFNFHIFPPK